MINNNCDITKYQDKFLVRTPNYQFLINPMEFTSKDFEVDIHGNKVPLNVVNKIHGDFVYRLRNDSTLTGKTFLKNGEILTRFQGLRRITAEECIQYTNNKKSFFILEFCLKSFSIFMFLCGIAILFVPFSDKVRKDNFLMIIVSIILFLGIAFLFLYAGFSLYKASDKNRVIRNSLKKGNGYIADCFSFCKVKPDNGVTNYRMYVWDRCGNCLSDYFIITPEVYNSDLEIKGKLYVVENNGKVLFDVIPVLELKN